MTLSDDMQHRPGISKLALAFLVALLFIAGCDSTEAPTAPAVVQSSEPKTMSPEVTERWVRSCALCHVRGEAGAPKTGDQEAWAPRLAQGRVLLMEHTIEGWNMMPPLGYCMACEEDDFVQMIEFMSGGEL